MRRWKNKEIKLLEQNYPTKGKHWCATRLSRGEASIRAKAASLGLKIDRDGEFFKDYQKRAAQSKLGVKRPAQSAVMKRMHKEGKLKQSTSSRAASGRGVSRYFAKHGHPKGMKGKHHSAETCKLFSSQRRGRKLNLTPAGRRRLSDSASAMMPKRLANKGTVYSRSTSGWYRIGRRKYYFRSSWEVVYARYLEWLRRKGEIKSWEYEPDTFWFESIKRGVRSYMPDFKVTKNDQNIEYHEVKGWLDPKSKTKLARMDRYYPDVTLILIAKDEYQAVNQWERLFPEAKKLT